MVTNCCTCNKRIVKHKSINLGGENSYFCSSKCANTKVDKRFKEMGIKPVRRK